ncbi:hypothetical protein, partial [Desertihabitans aurantiacus]|uniref:hypothetical protein n=1 Tax=Desertihabitans aurantiacus TaxID=2282477 RepID=UPI000DF7EACF
SPSAPASPGPGEEQAPADGERGPRGGGHGPGGFDTAALAERLGVEEEALVTALQELREEQRQARESADGERPAPDERIAELASALAEKLGIEESVVTDAVEELRSERQAERAARVEERLTRAVEDGTLTQAEADAVRKAIEEGVLGGR